jgi:uncharacterized protein
MPQVRSKHLKRLDPRGPLVFDTRTLGPGSARSETRTAPAPAELGAGLVRIPEGSDLELAVQLEGVTEGVLVTATVTAPLAGECARCLDPFTSAMQVRFQELYAYEAAGREQDGYEEQDGYLLEGDLLDLEPALRDALVLELPLSPLCEDDCAGLCSECGVRLAEAGPDHGHAETGGVWAVLKDFDAAGAATDPQQETSGPDGTPVPEAAPDGTPVPGRAKEL